MIFVRAAQQLGQVGSSLDRVPPKASTLSVPMETQLSRCSAKKETNPPFGSHTWPVISQGLGSKLGQLEKLILSRETRQELSSQWELYLLLGVREKTRHSAAWTERAARGAH